MLNLPQWLRYEPETGNFYWLNRIRRNGVTAGNLAGSKKKSTGYVVIEVDGRRYRAHRLAWLYMTGRWPVSDVDHINRDRADNRWVNLREATRTENLANTGKRPSNTSGFKGVYLYRGTNKWFSTIQVDGKRTYLGYFDSKEEAYAAYLAAAYAAHGEYADSPSDAVN